MNLTHNNHLRWWTDDKLFARRRHQKDTFKFELGERPSIVRPWGQEIKLAFAKLFDEHGTKLSLFYSGGSDSEVVLRTMVKMGVKPEVYTIKFDNGLNLHETHAASEVCAELGVKQNIIYHNVLDYVRSQAYLLLAQRVQCTQLAYLTVMQYIDQTDNPVIMGGEVNLQKHQEPSPYVTSPSHWYYVYREDEDGSTYRYSTSYWHKVINEIMTYTPEMFYAWIEHPIAQEALQNKMIGKITFLTVKQKIYEQELGITLSAKTKYHGYEALLYTNQEVTAKIKQTYPLLEGHQAARLKISDWARI